MCRRNKLLKVDDLSGDHSAHSSALMGAHRSQKLEQAVQLTHCLVLCRRNKLLKEGDANLSGDHVREGLCGVISVKVRCLLPVSCTSSSRAAGGASVHAPMAAAKLQIPTRMSTASSQHECWTAAAWSTTLCTEPRSKNHAHRQACSEAADRPVHRRSPTPSLRGRPRRAWATQRSASWLTAWWLRCVRIPAV